MTKPIVRAACYARTSTPDQKTCNSQLDLGRELVQHRGWQHRFRLKDEGLRGHDDPRPAFDRLMELVADHRIDVIVVWKLDRLFRSLKEASATQEFLAANDVALVSYTEPFDTTSSVGRFVFGLLANVGQFETELIKERSLLGYERRVREGKWTGAHVPFGYLRGDDGALQVNPEEASEIQWMYRNYTRLGGDSVVARHLNGEGKTWKGRAWHGERVRQVLTNPITKGELTQRGVTATHRALAIVSPKVWKHHQEARRQMKRRNNRPRRLRDKEADIERVFQAYINSLEDCV